MTVQSGLTRLLWASIAATLGWVFGSYVWDLSDSYILLTLPLAASFALGRVKRFEAFSVYAGFYCKGTLPFAAIATSLFGVSSTTGTAMWLVHGLVCSSPILLLRGKSLGIRAVTVLLLFVLPPFGYFAPNNASIVLGALYPSTGAIGLGLMMLFVYSMGEFDRSRVAKGIFVSTLGVAVISNVYWSFADKRESAVFGISTFFGNNGQSLETRLDVGNIKAPRELKDQLKNVEGRIALMPEGMLYDVSGFTSDQWLEAVGRRNVVIAGFYEPDDEGLTMKSRAIAFGESPLVDGINAQLSKIASSSPFPFSMWHPWEKFEHFPLQWPNMPIRVASERLHISWCYEDTLVWPHLLASFFYPDVFGSIENRWSTKNTSLEAAQNVGAKLNARLLGATLVQSTNR